MKRGIPLFLIILLINSSFISAFNLNEFSDLLTVTGKTTQNNQDEKSLIESCKFKSTGPEVVMQKTNSNQVLIWLYEPDKERFGELKIITDFEKINENKYNFRVEENGPIYTVKAVIPDFCIRPKNQQNFVLINEKAEFDNYDENAKSDFLIRASVSSQTACERETSLPLCSLTLTSNQRCCFNAPLINSETMFDSSLNTLFNRCYYSVPPSSWYPNCPNVNICPELSGNTPSQCDSNGCPPCGQTFSCTIDAGICSSSEHPDECSDLRNEPSCESSYLNCQWISQETINLPVIPAECSKNGIENVFLRASRAISAIFGNILLLFVKIILFIPNLLGLKADMPFLPLTVDCSQYNMKIQTIKEATTRGSCEMGREECRKVTHLGDIEVEGGVWNWVPRDLRLSGYSKLSTNLVQISKTKRIIESDFIVKMWIHKDLYKEEYNTFTKYNHPLITPPEGYVSDLLDLSKHFPPYDWGITNSFIIILHTTVREEEGKAKITLESKYQKASDTKQDKRAKDFEIFLSERQPVVETVEKIDYSQNFNQIVRVISKIFVMYVVYHDDDLKASLYGVGPYPEHKTASPDYANTLVNDWVKQEELNGLRADDMKEGKKYDQNVLWKVRRSLEEKIKKISDQLQCK